MVLDTKSVLTVNKLISSFLLVLTYGTRNKDIAFAKRLERIRRQANLTQEQQADKARLSTTFIGLLETELRRSSIDESLNKIAKALGVKTRDLIPYKLPCQ